jgi:hypothetical protein
MMRSLSFSQTKKSLPPLSGGRRQCLMFCFKFYLALLSARELTVAVLIQAGGMPEFQVTVKYRKVLKQDHANN